MNRAGFFATLFQAAAVPLALATASAIPATEVIEEDAPLAGYGGGWAMMRCLLNAPRMNAFERLGEIRTIPLRPSMLDMFERMESVDRIFMYDANRVVREIIDVSRGIYAR